MAKTLTISDKLHAHLVKLASEKLDSLWLSWHDAASWGNVDDSMHWAMEQAERMLAHEILNGEPQ